jgi:hypothetical protein
MELKYLVLYSLIGCICIGFGIGRFILARHASDMGTILNPKTISFSQKEKIAIFISLVFLLIALILFIYGFHLWHY